MKIDKIKIKNFKCYGDTFETDLNAGVNVIVGNNESGKSTILEAIHLALTGMLNGRYLRNELSTYLFNIDAVKNYTQSLTTGTPEMLPEILIELYFSGDDPQFAEFQGNLNSDKDNKVSGVRYKIEFDEIYLAEYNELVKTGEITSIPIEYYRTAWQAFARKEITARSIPMKSALIDTSNVRMHSGSDIYISRIIKENLEDREKVEISQAHRKMREGFMRDEKVEAINAKINKAAKITNKPVSISVDLSTQTAWESSLMTYIDEIPFHYVGKGEQCIVKTKLALSNKKSAEAAILLIEEPENHLTHSKLNELISDISADNGDKQIIISTHSSFVANKLGLSNLVLLRNATTVRIKQLDSSDFFQKLAGYDTLRLILSSKSILVEGDSDELVVQRAYMDANGGILPIAKDIDVISVGTSFLRFLELAGRLGIPVAVATDNDGDIDALKQKYADYLKNDLFKICFDSEIDSGALQIGDKPFNYNTLEPKILKVNGLEKLNSVFGTQKSSEDEMNIYMRNHKTDCALSIFSSKHKITYPQYINEAIKI